MNFTFKSHNGNHLKTKKLSDLWTEMDWVLKVLHLKMGLF